MKENRTKPGPWSLFITFFSISALTLGGGYAMIPVFADRMARKKWMGEKEFYELFALGQAVPGPLALNTAVLVGKRLAGISGAAVSFAGIILPPFIAIILVSLVFSRIGEYPFIAGFLKGSYGVVIGLVLVMLVKMLKTRKWSFIQLMISAIGAAALFFLSGYALIIFIIVAVFSYGVNRK